MPRVIVVGVCELGWFERSLTLAQFARQRANLARCSVLHAWIEGALA